jgi:putative transposase
VRYLLTDELWDLFEPLVEKAKPYTGGQRPQLSERMFFEALLYIGRTGIPWRDLPAEFGSWDAVYKQFRRWIHSGRLAKLFEILTDNPAFDEVKRVLVDLTVVRAHRHAAGALQKKGSADDQALDPSRGGFSTKIVAIAVDKDTEDWLEFVPGASGLALRIARDGVRRLRAPQYDAQRRMAEWLAQRPVGPDHLDDLGWVVLLAPQLIDEPLGLGLQRGGFAAGLVTSL